MGSLDTKSDPIILEEKHETESNKSETPLDTPTTSDKSDLLELTSASDNEDNDKKVFPIPSPSSSKASTNSISEDTLQDSDSKNYKNGGKVNEGIDHTSETPPIQVMERPTTPKYRIPSSVFDRKQSGSQDWAMASNESLFSIQMSFNYQDSINWRSGEIERHIQEAGTIPETGKTHGSETGKAHKLGEEDKIHGSSVPDESVKPNSQENQECVSHCCAESESAKSFTFPILTGETEKGGSLEAISENEQPEPQPKPKPDAPPPTWTNCFGCCTFCS